MITVISGTNRPDSSTLLIARHYVQRLQDLGGESVQFLSLEDLPADLIQRDMYSPENQAPAVVAMQDQYLLGADKWVFIMPEYNGSFPGVLKLFIDACSVRELKGTFRGKKAALVGIATGRAGNLRGMDHLTGILHYLGTLVLPLQLPVSRVGTLKNEGGELVDEPTLLAIDEQIGQFLDF